MRSNFQNLITENVDEFGKVGGEMHSDYDSAESIQTRILKMENYEKCWLHHCICKVERTVNHLKYQLHRGNLLQ